MADSKKSLKTEFIHVKISPEEQKTLQALAEEHTLTVSAYLRMLIAREAKKMLK